MTDAGPMFLMWLFVEPSFESVLAVGSTRVNLKGNIVSGLNNGEASC